MISFLRIGKKRLSKKEVIKNDSLESLKKEKINLLKENQRLEQENNLLYLQHLKTLIGMKTEIGRYDIERYEIGCFHIR